MSRLIERFPLARGRHDHPGQGLCAMELVAWLAGEEHSDEPRCACPVLAALVRAANDRMPPELRERYLRPLAPRLVGSRADAATAERRAFALADHALRVLGPMALERRGRYAAAAGLRAEPAVVDAAAAGAAAAIARGTAPELRALHWTLRRAVGGMPPWLWVTGVAHVAEAVGDGAGWRELVRGLRRLVMKIEVSRDAPDSTVQTGNGSPAIAKNEAKTETLVKDGQTLVLGGIYTIDKSFRQSRVPYLHRIPIIGTAFKSKEVSDKRKELLIFVTPRIVVQPGLAS